MPDVQHLLPCPEPVRLLSSAGELIHDAPSDAAGARGYALPDTEDLLAVWRSMVIGRRFDTQATALTRQGRLAVYPSSRGQDACQSAPVHLLDEHDWLFPTYRDTVALVSRGIDPVQALTLLRGDWHCGYDPQQTRTAPQCTPLATQSVHAAGTAYALRRRGTEAIALCLLGDGATSEGDFHEALNFAAVFEAPVVFFVQNNGFAISVPLAKQTRAPALAYKGVGYGVPSEQVDGNDAAAVLAVTRAAIEHARSGGGPFLIEAHTYRLEAHTNADDATRYRSEEDVQTWRGRDPIDRLQTYLVAQDHLDQTRIDQVGAEAEALAADLRSRMSIEPPVRTPELFEHVYAEPTPQLREQAALVAAEEAALVAAEEAGSSHLEVRR